MRASTHDTCLQQTQTLVTLCQELWWLVNKEKSELAPKQVFNFVGYQFELQEGARLDQQQNVGRPSQTKSDQYCRIRYARSESSYPHRSTHSNRKTSPPRATSHEAHTVALEKQLEGPRVTKKVIPVPNSLHPHLRWWLEESNNSDCPRVAQHALVLGSSGNVQSNPTVSAQHTKLSVSAIQPGPSQEPVNSKPTCLAPRASAIKEQGFSEAVAARIEAPQRRSTRSVYEAKWTIFTKWCLCNQVYVRAPPLKAIADFLLHLFQDRKLQPGTIDGYRLAIADKLGNSTINVSKDENLSCLLDSFQRDRPKGRRGIPSWNLSLVLHQLTKAPFEPLKEASLKHLTFKTVFLLALGSGKRRSEIHTWLHKNIRHQSDWSNVSLYPSPSFLSKNQLAKEGPDSVAPVVIPTLAPSLDRSLKGDRSLCPVRALRYYLDRISDLRQNKELLFVSFKKGFDKDISPATISSWIKQTVILCYELSDQEALSLHQVKAHDVRAFAASKAFQ